MDHPRKEGCVDYAMSEGYMDRHGERVRWRTQGEKGRMIVHGGENSSVDQARDQSEVSLPEGSESQLLIRWRR